MGSNPAYLLKSFLLYGIWKGLLHTKQMIIQDKGNKIENKSLYEKKNSLSEIILPFVLWFTHWKKCASSKEQKKS